MLKKILVATDGSKLASKAIETAVDLAKQNQAKLYILTVVPEAAYYEHYPMVFPYGPEVLKANEERAKVLLDEAKKQVAYDGNVETYYALGSAGKEIIDFSNDHDVDLIVLGNRGLGAFSRTLLGSVSNKVINHSQRSVLVVKDLEEEAQ
ncbi:MAG: universal stress protein [Tissierellia bacterium]|nr:universal stress protein [Tissierellia bacterium]